MKNKIFLTLLVLVIAGVVTGAQQSIEPRPHQFVISNMKTAFATQGDFEGEYRIYKDRIVLHMTKAIIRISDHCPYDGRRLITALRFGLAESTEKSWKPSNLVGFHLNRIMVPNDGFDLGEMEFSIPRDDSFDLSMRWLVVQIDETALDGVIEENPNGYSFAHSQRDIFARP
jgi:hypothetical protein